MKMGNSSCGFRDEDFLRIDKKGYKPTSFLQKKLNELPTINPVIAFYLKLILFPAYLIYSRSLPIVKATKISKQIRSLRYSNQFSALCLRTRLFFVFDLMSRVVILDEKRINKRGQTYQNLRNEINKCKALGYTSEIVLGEMAIELLDNYCLTRAGRNWRNETRYSSGKYDCNIFACVGFNSDKEISALNAVIFTGPYAYMFFYSGLVKENIRWLITEHAIEFAYNQGVSIFHTDNLLDVSIGSYIFQKEMGYKTVRLKFK